MSQLKDLDIPVFLQSGWFDGDGKLGSSLPGGGKEYDKYLYDPGDPTPCPFYYFKSEAEEKKEGETIIDVEEAKARNLNTGGHNEMETEYVKATQQIYHSPEYPSHILLPVIKK